MTKTEKETAIPRMANIILSPSDPVRVDPVRVDPVRAAPVRADPVPGACVPPPSANRRAVAHLARSESPPGTKAAKTKPDSHPAVAERRDPPLPDATPPG